MRESVRFETLKALILPNLHPTRLIEAIYPGYSP
jgi:hypothetical protein